MPQGVLGTQQHEIGAAMAALGYEGGRIAALEGALAALGQKQAELGQKQRIAAEASRKRILEILEDALVKGQVESVK